MSAFLDKLDLEMMVDPNGRPLLTRQGRQLWRVLSRFRYMSDVVAAYRKSAGIAEPAPTMPGLMETPDGFVTDLCSKPQITLAFMGDNEQQISVPHDYAYATHCIPRGVADHMLYEGCILTGTPGWRAALIYAGVRIGGGSHWDPAPAANDAAVTATA